GGGKGWPPNVLQTGFLGDIGEGTVAIVAEQYALAHIKPGSGAVEVDEAIVVVVARNHRERVGRDIDSGGDRHVGEGAVAVVAIEIRAAVSRSDAEIEQAVVV